RKRLLLSSLALVLLTFIAVIVGHNLISLQAGGGIQSLFILYLLLLLVGGGFFASNNLGDLSSVARRINYMSIPASTFEKFLSKWLYTLPLYAGAISLLIWAFFKGYLAIFGDIFSPEAFSIAHKMEHTIAVAFLQLYVFGHALAFLFSFLFNSYAAIKGALLSLGLIVFSGIIYTFFLPDLGLGFFENLGQAIWGMMSNIVMQPIVLMLISPIFWAITYLIFRRKSA
ncbi:MAG: hypothetical protein AAF696_31140, partial [Bacteroidota bacterium]